MRHPTLALSLLGTTAAAAAASIPKTNQIPYPKTTGPYRVGYTHLELIDHARPDIYAPTHTPRDLMGTLHYPISPSQPNCSTSSPLLTPLLATYLDILLAQPLGTFSKFSLPSCRDAALAHPELPLLLFSHGFKGSRLLYAGFLQEIASQGYNVFAIDHPYDAAVVEYPDGRAVFNALSDDEPGAVELDLGVRVQDVRFALDALDNATITAQIPGLSVAGCEDGKGGLKTSRVGVMGHSFGGSTTLQTTSDDARFVAGTSLDGPFWGAVNQTGTDAAILSLVAKQPSSETWVGEWSATWPRLRGFKRWFDVEGTLHLSFDDFPLLADLLGADDVRDVVGNVTGERMIAVQTAFAKSFFDGVLKNGTDGLLDGVGAEEWPEVALVRD